MPDLKKLIDVKCNDLSAKLKDSMDKKIKKALQQDKVETRLKIIEDDIVRLKIEGVQARAVVSAMSGMSHDANKDEPPTIQRLPSPEALQHAMSSMSPSSLSGKLPGMSEEMVELLVNEKLDERLDELEERFRGQITMLKDLLDAEVKAIKDAVPESTDSEAERDQVQLMIDRRVEAAAEKLE